MQHKGLTKLARYNYEIVYRKGKQNREADAFSRLHEENKEPIIMAQSLPIAGILYFNRNGRRIRKFNYL